MRFALILGPSLLIAGLFAAAACGDSNSSSSSSGGPGENESGTDAPIDPTKDAAEDTSTGDAGKDVEQPLTVATEVEPNDGQPITAVNVMKLPGTMNGTIDPTGKPVAADDIDIFTIDITPGEFWEWTAVTTSADLAPLITVFDTANNTLNPTAIGYSAAGAPAKLQHFVLRPGTFVAAMRDARNRSPSQKKGGPTYGYALTGKRATPQPIAVTFPITKTGKLASVGSVDLYTFTGTGGKGFDIVINAARKIPASTLDSRLSLFDITAKKAIITNDNVSQTISDSQIGSPDAFPSTYMVIVENEGINEADLSYEIQFKLRP
jgi:hypothetical protein